MKPEPPDVAALLAERDALRRQLEQARASLPVAEPPARGVTKRRDVAAGTTVLDIGAASDEEGDMYGALVAEFMRAAQVLETVGGTGSIVVTVAMAPNRPVAVSAEIKVKTPRLKAS